MAVNQYNVSDTLGDDTAGDGSPNSPFKTANAAIAAGVTAGLADISLMLDAATGATYTVTVPDGVKVAVKTTANHTPLSGSKIDVLMIGGGSFASVGNVHVELVKEGAGVGARTLVAVSSQIDEIKDNAETGPATHTTGSFNGVFGGSTLLTDIGGMAFFEGTVIINNVLTPLVGLDMNGGSITKCAAVEGPAASEVGMEAGTGFGTYCKLGDKAGATAHEIRDSDGVVVGKVTSDGDLDVAGDVVVGGTVAGVDIAAHASDPSAHHTRYSDTEADARVSAGIATHTALPSAHHTRYTDGEADARVALHAGLTNNPHAVTAAQAGAAPLVHTHAPSDVTGTAVITTDPRLSDARMPLSHTHAPADVTGTAIIEGDPRLTDARTPMAHVHAATDVNSGTLDGDRLPALSATKRGGVPATGTPSGKYLKDDGTWDSGTPAFGSEFAETSSDAEATNATTTYSDKIDYTTASLTSGQKYRVAWFFEGKVANPGEQAEFNILIDGSSRGFAEIKDNYYNGEQSGFYYYTPGSTGTKVIKIQHRVKTGTTGTSYIKNARVEIWRVA